MSKFIRGHPFKKGVSPSGLLKPLYKAGLKPGVNWRKELTELIMDIAARDDIGSSDVLKAPEIQMVLNNKKLSGPQKLKKVKDLLFARRYPTVALASGPKNIRVTQPKSKITMAASHSTKISRLLVEKSVSDHSLTKSILSKYNSLPVQYVDKIKLQKNGFKSGDLLVAAQKGKFLKRCPGTPKYNCCDYYVLNLGIGCNFNCTYCYLHQYMNSPFVVYVNVEDVIKEVRQFCTSHPSKIIRLGSGEFIDSLGFDEIVNVHQTLIPALSKIPNLLFEVKTKSNRVDHLLSLEHRNRVVASFSINSIDMAQSEEPGAASVPQRIEAAAKCQEAGYKIGFHFDPLIYYPGWQEGYKQVVDLIFEHIKPKNIAWISLGALRFNPHLKPVIQAKFPDSRIIYGELVPGLDGKLRYFITIRKKMFKALVSFIKAYSKEVPVYLCMENKSLAEEVDATPNFSIRNQ